MKKIFIFVCALPFLFASEAYKSKDFSYLLGKVKGFDDSLLKMHFQLYEGYVKNTNHLIQLLNNKSFDDPAVYGALKRRFGWEFDGMVLHELYFSNLSIHPKPLSNKAPLYQAIEENFKSFKAFQDEFVSTGMIRGIGWVILYMDPNDHQLRILWINEHDLGHLAGGKPLLIMDVWEHAYLTEFGLDRKAYILAFFENIDWEVVNTRFKEVLLSSSFKVKKK